MEELIKRLDGIEDTLKKILYKDSIQPLPRVIYVKELVANYKFNDNKATSICKKYGVNFGGWCIEADKLKEVLQTEIGKKIE